MNQDPIKFLHNDIINALLTDSYKIVMSYAFFQENMHEQNTAFELFFRKCPFDGQYAIVAGIHEAMAFVSNFKFTQDQIDYIKKAIFPPDANPAFFDYLLKIDCSKVQIRGFREGDIAFPNEPLLAFEGPQVICQLLETPLINLISYPTLIATNASRMRRIVGDKVKLVEFGLRRAQGPDGGFSASHYSYIGGFDGTSNVVAGQRLGIPVVGTVAHSYVTSFLSLSQIEVFCLQIYILSIQDKSINGVNIKKVASEYRQKLRFTSNEGELAAFISYAVALPNNFLALVDTYDTLSSGVPNFLCVAFALIEAGVKPKGIRIDSGDLVELSIKSKELFRKYGEKCGKDTSYFQVVASNDINENSLLKFVEQNHQIDVFGIGTNLVTCQKQPALGLVKKFINKQNEVYKLVECDGNNTMKLSEEVEKTTLPCQKNVFRLYFNSTERPIVDIITLRNQEIVPNEEIRGIDPKNQNKRYTLKPARVENLLKMLWDKTCIRDNVLSLEDAKKNVTDQIAKFDQSILKVEKPKPHLTLLSEQFYQVFREKIDSLIIYKLIE